MSAAAAGLPFAAGTARSGRLRVAARTVLLVIRSPHGAFATTALGAAGVAIALAPFLAPVSPDAVDVLDRFAGPSWSHPLGTDWLGRDEWSRLLYGGRASLGVALVVAVSAGAFGTALGVALGYLGGALDLLVMRVVDATMAIPSLLVSLAVLAVLGPGLPNLVIAMVSTWWVGYARVVRARVLVLREQPYVEAARAMGAARWRVVLRHLLPGVLGELVVYFALDFGGALLGVTAFSFLGLGLHPPAPEWGSMMAAAESYQVRDAWLIVIPGSAIGLVVLSAYLLADRVRDVVDPRTRGEPARGRARSWPPRGRAS